MRLDNGTIVFRGTLVGNAYVSATRWNRVLTGSGSVLRSALGGPHLPPSPLPLPVEERGDRSVAGAKEYWHPLT